MSQLCANILKTARLILGPNDGETSARRRNRKLSHGQGSVGRSEPLRVRSEFAIRKNLINKLNGSVDIKFNAELNSERRTTSAEKHCTTCTEGTGRRSGRFILFPVDGLKRTSERLPGEWILT